MFLATREAPVISFNEPKDSANISVVPNPNEVNAFCVKLKLLTLSNSSISSCSFFFLERSSVPSIIDLSLTNCSLALASVSSMSPNLPPVPPAKNAPLAVYMAAVPQAL